MMSGPWKTLMPVWVNADLLPSKWSLIHDEKLDHYAVVGNSSPDLVDVVIRVEYAHGMNGSDIRRMVGTAIALGMSGALARTAGKSRLRTEKAISQTEFRRFRDLYR